MSRACRCAFAETREVGAQWLKRVRLPRALIMDEMPVSFAWQNLPPHVRRFLVERLRDRMLEWHEGPIGLIRWLYAGTTRPNGTRAAYNGTPEYYYRLVVEDLPAWHANRPTHPPSSSTQE